jgi:ABC-type multidrug transport system ATPase subunit
MDRAIDVRQIVKTFGDTVALNKVSFGSARGINIILGPNGAGKSTFLRCVDGLYRVERGSVSVLGTDPYKNDSLKEKLSLLTDNYALYDYLSVANNLKFFGRLYGLSDSETLRRAGSMLKKLDAIEYLDRKVYMLSRGTKQKIAFCRAVLSEPEILLLDEPTAFLDAHSAEMVREVLAEYDREGKTILFVTQKLDEVTRFNGKISIMGHGHIVKETTTDGLYNVVLKNTVVNFRLARPVKRSTVRRLAGFVEANGDDATVIKVRVRDYKDISRTIKGLLDAGVDIVSIDYIEHLIDDLSR